MKNVLVLAGAAMFFIGTTVYAASPMGPAMKGETGIMRVISAESLPQTGAMFGVDGLYFRDTDLLNTAGDINQRIEGNVNLTYGVADWLEVFINGANAAQSIKNSTTNRNDLYQSPGDLTGVMAEGKGSTFVRPISTAASIARPLAGVNLNPGVTYCGDWLYFKWGSEEFLPVLTS